MESFFLSETSKYLFLLGANATQLPDFYVLTTEGHLLPPLPTSAARGAGLGSGAAPMLAEARVTCLARHMPHATGNAHWLTGACNAAAMCIAAEPFRAAGVATWDSCFGDNTPHLQVSRLAMGWSTQKDAGHGTDTWQYLLQASLLRRPGEQPTSKPVPAAVLPAMAQRTTVATPARAAMAAAPTTRMQREPYKTAATPAALEQHQRRQANQLPTLLARQSGRRCRRRAPSCAGGRAAPSGRRRRRHCSQRCRCSMPTPNTCGYFGEGNSRFVAAFSMSGECYTIRLAINTACTEFCMVETEMLASRPSAYTHAGTTAFGAPETQP